MRDIHTDHVGSLLRPQELLHAREAFADGTIGPADLKAAEDRAIDHVVTLQEQAGCEIITDGELRRLSFQSQILESVDGFGEWTWRPSCGVTGTAKASSHGTADAQSVSEW